MKGIGNQKFARIKDLITVGGPGEEVAPTKGTGATAGGAMATPAKKKRGREATATPAPTK